MERDIIQVIGELQKEIRRLDRERKWHAIAIIGALVCIFLLALAGAANAKA